MSVSNGIISAPVSISDIQNAIGTSGGGDLATLCKSNNIKMWAKWKPVPKNLIDTTPQLSGTSWQTDSQLSNNPWWKGNDGNYGLTFQSVGISLGQTGMETALTSLLQHLDGDRNGWRYLHPGGGNTSPYRQLDFLKYNHNAPNPIRQFSCTPDVTAAELSEWEVSASYMSVDFSTPISTRDYLVPTDITGYTLYPGIAIFKKSGNTYTPIAWCTGNAWRGKGIKSASYTDGIDGRGDTEVHTIFSSEHRYYMIPVYFTCQLPQSGPGYSALPTVGNQKVIPVPYVDFDYFDCTQAATSQRYGYPDISNSTVRSGAGATLGMYASNFTLDSRDSYYLGGSGVMQVLVVNSTWDGTWTPSSSMCAFNQTYNFTIGSSEIITVGSCDITLDLTKQGWKVVMNVAGSVVEHALRTTVTPTTT